MALTAAQLQAFLLALAGGTPPGTLGDAYYGAGITVSNYYVAKTGTDAAGFGLALATPCLTVNYATALACAANVAGGVATINIGAGTFVESVFVNGPLTGGCNNNPNPSGSVPNGPSMVLFSGAGSGSTILSGAGTTNVTLCPSDGAVIGIRALKLIGTGTAGQSPLFIQLAGTANIFDDVIFGAASQAQIHVEDTGSSCQVWASYTVNGNAPFHCSVGDGKYVLAAGTVTFSGALTFSTSTFYVGSQGTVQFNVATPFTVPGGSSVTGKRFTLVANGVIETNGLTSATLIPGSLPGIEASGGYYRGPLIATVAAASGVGNGSVSVVGDSHAGVITLTAGSTTAAAGSVLLSFPSTTSLFPFSIALSG